MIISKKFINYYSDFITSFTRKLVNIIYKFKYIIFGKPLNRFAKKKASKSKKKLYNRITSLLLFSNRIIKFFLHRNILIVKRNQFFKLNSSKVIYLSTLPPIMLQLREKSDLNLKLFDARSEIKGLIRRYEKDRTRLEKLLANEHDYIIKQKNKYSFNMDPSRVIAKPTDNSLAFAREESMNRNIKDSHIVDMIRNKAHPNLKLNESVMFERSDYIVFVRHIRDDVAIDSIPEPLNNKIVHEVMPVIENTYKTLKKADDILVNCANMENNFNIRYNIIKPSPLLDVLSEFQVYIADLETFASLA
jgi:hypothetical protein